MGSQRGGDEQATTTTVADANNLQTKLADMMTPPSVLRSEGTLAEVVR
jgi:hypothetical protein